MVENDVTSTAEVQPEEEYSIKEAQFRIRAIQRRIQHSNEVALKGLFVDDLFKKLNLQKYR